MAGITFYITANEDFHENVLACNKRYRALERTDERVQLLDDDNGRSRLDWLERLPWQQTTKMTT